MEPQAQAGSDTAPLGAGVGAVPRIRDVPFDAPWRWLSAGWNDMWTVPGVSLTYGAVFALCAMLIAFGLTQLGWLPLVLVLAGGFLLIGPMLAVGLYEASRRLAAGTPVRIADVAIVGVVSRGQLAFMGALLLFAYIVWVEIALLLFMLFFGGSGLPAMQDFVQTLLFSNHGLGLLITGTAIGAVLAITVFAISAVSVPLLMVHKLDVVTAMTTSVRAVWQNPKAMLLWAALIAAAMACGIAVLFVGLVIAFPLFGHATWHAYVDLVEFDD